MNRKILTLLVLIMVFSVACNQGQSEQGLRLILEKATDFAWSPDMERIAFSSDREGQLEVFVVDINGENLVRVVEFTDSMTSYNPVWSPDGKRIAFNLQFVSYDIVVVEIEEIINGSLHPFDVGARALSGAGISELLFEEDNNNPDWSPSGGKLVFDPSIIDNSEIYIMDADGSNAVLLEGQMGDNLIPRWSPDGEWIVFESKRTGNWDLFALHLESGELVQLTFDEGKDFSAAWSPDGSLIGFTSSRSGEGALYVIDAP